MTQKKHSDIAEQKYRPLKKRLKIPYKKIEKDMEAGKLPLARVLTEFMDLSKIMISYSGFGDERYQEYKDACLTFEKACRAGDTALAQRQFATIKKIKHECHKRR